jgi:hypothetical protein
MAVGVAVPSQTRLFFLGQISKNVFWLCHSTKQALLNDFGLKFFSPSAVTNGVQCGIFLEQLSIYYAFYTPKNTVHPIFGPGNHILVLA